jgi:Phytanoyl-CoA dioxygenase (PhyH)
VISFTEIKSVMASDIYTRGYTLLKGLLGPLEVDELIENLGPVSGAGQRGMLADPLVRDLAHSSLLMDAVRPHLTGAPRPVRAIYFDKSPGANWLVTWHQDLTICVTEQMDAPGFGPWSTKDGLIHVQPPAEVLQGMITLRLHLDAADETNGALRVLPGSHAHGKLGAAEIEQLRASIPEITCSAEKGDALLMRPLILHASGRSSSQRHRRILHIEYAGIDLPHGLNWNHAA